MNLRATKIKEYDTKEMKRLIQNTDLKVTIHDTRDHKYSRRDFYTVFWRNDGGPETMGCVLKKKMTKRFAIRICNWIDMLPISLCWSSLFSRRTKDMDAEELEYLRNTAIKEYEPV